MKQLIGILCSLLMFLPLVACNMLDEIVNQSSRAPDGALEKISTADGARGQEGISGQSVSTDDVFPPGDDINGEKPKEVPIGREEGVEQLKENPVPSEGPAEEDEAEEN